MSEDLIRRSDAIKALRKLGHEVVVIDKVCSLGVAQEFIDVIRELPSADRPQGEWMHDTSSPIAYRCSACNTLQHWSVIQNGQYHFCSNCGDKVMVQHLEDEWFCRHCGADMGMKGADDD